MRDPVLVVESVRLDEVYVLEGDDASLCRVAGGSCRLEAYL